jgi:very-short-patch-repair endonuclease
LRNLATPEERLLWTYLRHVRPRFTRQLPVGGYIVDFACRTAKLAVELDGSQHLDAADYDSRRTIVLEGLDWQVLRFWNSEVRDNAEGIAAVIAAAVDARLGRTHP